MLSASAISPSVLVIDDHALFRSGLEMVLASGIEGLQVGQAASLEEVMRGSGPAPSLVLLDIQLKGLNGLEGLALLRRKWPRTPVVMVSSDATPDTVREAMERGAAAFVSKDDTADSIVSVIEPLLHGMPPAQRRPAAASEPNRLTPRQCEVLDLMCQGLSNKAIGRRLDLSENTVRSHVQATLAFLQVSSRAEAAFAARRQGLVA
jgi:DNA-binding NarL/FixJ family response regulator